MIARQTHAADFEPRRIVPHFWDDHEAVDLSGKGQVVLIAQFDEIATALAEPQGFVNDHAMMLEAIPGQAGRVAEQHVGLLQHIDKSPGQERVFQRDFPISPRAKQMDGPRLLEELLADAAEIDKARHEDAAGLGSVEQRPGAIGRRQHQGALMTHVAGKVGGRIAQVKAVDGSAATFAAQKRCLALGGQLVRKSLRLLDRGHGPNGRATRRQGVNDRRAGAEHVNHNGHSAPQLLRRNQVGQQMDVKCLRHDGAFANSTESGQGGFPYYDQRFYGIKCTKRQVAGPRGNFLAIARAWVTILSMKSIVIAEKMAEPVFGGQDFRQFYAGAKLLGEGQNPYDPALVFEWQKVDAFDKVHVSVSPPTSFLPYLPLAPLPYVEAMHAHVGLNVLLLSLAVLGWRRMLFPGQRWLGIGLCAAIWLWRPVFLLVSLGQITAMVLAGFTGWVLAMGSGRSWLAGASLVLCAMKPHLGIIPIAFALGYGVRQRDWRFVLSFVCCSSLCLLLPWLLRPSVYDDWRAWLHATPLTFWLSSTLQAWGRVNFSGFSEQVMMFAWSIWGLGIALAALWGWRLSTQRLPLAHHAILLLAFDLAAAIHAFSYDYVLLLPGLVFGMGLWWTERRHVALLWLVLAFGFVYVRLGLMYEWELWIVAWLAMPLHLWLCRLQHSGKPPVMRINDPSNGLSANEQPMPTG